MVKFLIEYFLIIFIGIGIIWKVVLPAFGIGTYIWEKKKAKHEPGVNVINKNESDK